MTLNLPHINKNTLFTPSVLLVLLTLSYLLSRVNFKDPYNSYSILLGFASLIVSTKSFILGFANIEHHLKTKKWFLLGTDLILVSVQFWLSWLAVVVLTETSYPQDTIGWILLANVAYALLLFFGGVLSNIKISVASIVIYLGMFLLLLSKNFTTNNYVFIYTQQAIGIVTVVLELLMFFFVVRKFVKKS